MTAPTDLIHTGEAFDDDFDYKTLRNPDRFSPDEDEASLIVHDEAMFARIGVSSSEWEVFSDISKFQSPYNDSYRMHIASFRIDSGYTKDSHADANLAACRGLMSKGQLHLMVMYCVHIPGNVDSTVARISNFLGKLSKAELRRTVVMIDEESGPGFAGTGDHSSSFNSLAASLRSLFLPVYNLTYAGKHIWVYANRYDRSGNLPNMASWVTMEVRAQWNSRDPGTYAQQYAGGIHTAVPAGCPTSVAPFGSNVDLNVIRRSMSQIESDLGIASTPPVPVPPTPAPVEEDDDMKSYRVVKTPKGHFYVVDGINARHLTGTYIKAMQNIIAKAGGDGSLNTLAHELETYGYNVVGGPTWAGSPQANALVAEVAKVMQAAK